MKARDIIGKIGTGDVEIGMGSLKRVVGETQGWVCEHCGKARADISRPTSDASPCTSKVRKHKWRKV